MKLSQVNHLYSEQINFTNSHTARRSKSWLIGSCICLSDLRKVAEKLHSSNCDDSTQKQDKSHERSPCSPHALTTAWARSCTADTAVVSWSCQDAHISVQFGGFIGWFILCLHIQGIGPKRTVGLQITLIISGNNDLKKTGPRECFSWCVHIGFHILQFFCEQLSDITYSLSVFLWSQIMQL